MGLDELAELLEAPAADCRGDLSVAVDSVAYDSRNTGAGSLFCCIPGGVVDGHDFAREAVTRGSSALLVERFVDVDVPQLRVADGRRAMAVASDAIWHHPSGHLTVIGVTGTNGKTTTTHMLRAIFERAGVPSAVLGTLSGVRTTPEAPDLQAWLADRRDEGVQAVAMEVSSHSLELHRVDGTRFAAAVFTNLSRDHLDYHGTMESYFEAKARLFGPDFTDLAVVNLDDPYGRLLRDAAIVTTVGYSVDDATDLVVTARGSTFQWRGREVHLALGGRFNVSNAVAAATAAEQLGIDPGVIASGLGDVRSVPGRFEPVEGDQPFEVIVDFAHTPDALEQVLRAAREVALPNRTIVVFGCGGDRDDTKRPFMGQVAARFADVVVLTSDNSRSESTAAIIDAVRSGYDQVVDAVATELVVELDRDAAIGLAVRRAASGDVVVIAGKGHETTQTIGDQVNAFDDGEVARRHLRSFGAR